VLSMELTATNDEKISVMTRGLLRLEKAAHEQHLFKSDIQPILNAIYIEVCMMLTGDSHAELPTYEDILEQEDPLGTLENIVRSNDRGGFNRFFNDNRLSDARREQLTLGIGMTMIELETAESENLPKLTQILFENDKEYDQTVFSDLMLNGNEMALGADEFRRTFYEAVNPLAVKAGDDELMMRLPAPTIDYLQKDQYKHGYSDPTLVVESIWANWQEGTGAIVKAAGKHSVDCFENEGDPRLFRWFLEDMSNPSSELTLDDRKQMILHANCYAHEIHKDAAKALNTQDHEGASEYFVHELTRLIMLQSEVDSRGGTDPSVNLHRRFLEQQISILVYCMQEYYLTSQDSSAQEYVEEVFCSLGQQVSHLGPYISKFTTHSTWKERAEEGGKLKDTLYKGQLDLEEQSRHDGGVQKIKSDQLESQQLERKKLAVTRIMKGEAESTAGWEEPLEFLSARAREPKAIFYNRDTWRAGGGKLSKAEAFEMSLLSTLAEDQEVTNWIFTEPNRNINDIQVWLRSEGIIISSEQLKQEIQTWLRCDGRWKGLRQYLFGEGKWPADRGAMENNIVTAQVNYWQSICRTKLDLEDQGAEISLVLLFADVSLNESQKAAKLIKSLGGEKFIDIGGWSNEVQSKGNPFTREEMMVIHHTNMTRGYENSHYNTEDAFNHAAFAVAQGECGYGKTHQTSAIEFANNQRIENQYADSDDLKYHKNSLGWSYKVPGNHNAFGVSDYVCYTPGGPAGAAIEILEDADDTREPAFSGSGGSGGDGGGVATL